MTKSYMKDHGYEYEMYFACFILFLHIRRKINQERTCRCSTFRRSGINQLL